MGKIQKSMFYGVAIEHFLWPYWIESDDDLKYLKYPHALKRLH